MSLCLHVTRDSLRAWRVNRCLSADKGLTLYDMLGDVRVLYWMGWYTSLGGLGMSHVGRCVCDYWLF